MSQEASNPFRGPASNVEPPETPDTPKELELAGKGRRFGTLLVDYVGLTASLYLFLGAVAVVFGPAGLKTLRALLPPLALACLLAFVYYLYFEGIWNRTPGKWVFGTVVVSAKGGKPSLGQVAGRTLCRFIPFEALSFLGARGWHDSIPKTLVVRRPRAR